MNLEIYKLKKTLGPSKLIIIDKEKYILEIKNTDNLL